MTTEGACLHVNLNTTNAQVIQITAGQRVYVKGERDHGH